MEQNKQTVEPKPPRRSVASFVNGLAPETHTVTTIIITPETAQNWLGANTHNRRILEARVATYTKDMQEGRWEFTGDAIQFDTNGVLLNGQHRLLACIRSGVSFKCVVVRGLKPEAQDAIDMGGGRTAGQVVEMAGVKYGTAIAAISKLIVEYENYDKAFGKSKGGPSPIEVSRFALKHGAEIESEGALAAALKFGKHLGAYSVAGFCYHEFYKIDKDLTEKFFDELLAGGSPNTSPLFHLRERLLSGRSKAAKSRLIRRYVLAIFIKAWNAYVTGTPMKYLRWRETGPNPEEFPSIKGLSKKERESVLDRLVADAQEQGMGYGVNA
jgi:hypothetical protein